MEKSCWFRPEKTRAIEPANSCTGERMTEQKAKTGEHADGFKTATSLAAQGQTKGQLTQMAKEFAAQGRQSYAQGVMHAVLRIIKRERAEAKGHKPQASSDLGPVVITLDSSWGPHGCAA